LPGHGRRVIVRFVLGARRSRPSDARGGAGRTRAFVWTLGLLLPLALVILLRTAPSLDERWQERQAHFWIVLSVGVLNAALALVVSEAGRRRRDARLLLIGLAFLSSAGFLGLHALATPGELVSSANAGFVLATPVGLAVAGVLAAASAVEYRLDASLRVVRRSRPLTALVLAVIAAWAVVSLAELPPLRAGVRPGEITVPLTLVAAAGVPFYAYAAIAYLRVWARRRRRLALAVAFAFVLLAEALVVAVASLPASWRLSWWEWHVLMAISFAAIATAAWSEWYEERFSALYLDETLAGHRDVTVLFADLAGFTPFSEARDPEEVHAMLVAYFGQLTPMITDEFGGEVQDFVGDQIFAIFNKRGDRREHALDAARAALELQRRAEAIRAAHPEWPRFRVGLNTGPVLAGVVGDRGHRIHGVFGDTVNLGARLQGQARPGGIVIGAATRARLPEDADARPLPELHVKGKQQPVAAFVLHNLPPATETAGR
jgi:adenylate cyclase